MHGIHTAEYVPKRAFDKGDIIAIRLALYYSALCFSSKDCVKFRKRMAPVETGAVTKTNCL
jgi:hypothetical protein